MSKLKSSLTGMLVSLLLASAAFTQFLRAEDIIVGFQSTFETGHLSASL